MYRTILIALGPDTASRAAITQGVSLAEHHEADAVFLYLLPHFDTPVTEFPLLGIPSPAEFQRRATEAAHYMLASALRLAGEAGVRSTGLLGTGTDELSCVLQAATQSSADLIVVGASGAGALMRLIGGSVIPRLITHSSVPVMIVKEQAAAGHRQPGATARNRGGIAPIEPERCVATT